MANSLKELTVIEFVKIERLTSRLKTQVVHVLLFISFLLSGLFINGIQLLLFLVVVR